MKIKETKIIRRAITRDEYIAIVANRNVPANGIIYRALIEMGYVIDSFDNDLNMYSDHPYGTAEFKVDVERDIKPFEEIAYYVNKIQNICEKSGDTCFNGCPFELFAICPLDFSVFCENIEKILDGKEVIE